MGSPLTRIAKIVFAVVGAGLLSATAAYAAPGVAMSIDVTNSQITMVGPSGGTCRWTVLSTVTVINLTSVATTISAVDASADFSGGNGANGRVSSTIVDAGGLQAGVVLAPNETRSFPSVQTISTIPCRATYSQIEFRVSTPGRVNAGDAPFLENGSSVPLRTLAGGAALSALLAFALGVHQRPRRPGLDQPATPPRGMSRTGG